ncbi:MAG TPA: POTRA domain-containing protein [Vicinamibacterales bacterium]|jgi:outer membrane protein insertion porin family
MLKFRCFLAASLLAAAVSAQAQTTPAAPTAPAPTAPVPAAQAPAAQAPGTPRPVAPAAAGPKPTEGTLPLCGGMYQVGPPAKLPPGSSPPVIYYVAACFEKQGGYSVVDPQTYLYYMEMAHQVSDPSADKWVTYTDKTEQTILADFKRLWATNFLDDLSAETYDYVFSNGVVGKIILYNMEERQRVKIVDYVGSKKIEMSKIDDELKKKGIRIALDSFVDPGLVKQVAGTVRDLYADQGYEYAEVKPEVKPVSTATKTVNLTFHISEGPKVRIRSVDFLGNDALKDKTLAHKMKDNKGPNPWIPIFGRGGTYKESKFEDDADKVQQYYREEGYVKAQIGQPQLRILEDDADGKTRWVQLQIPVTEGQRYRVGDISFSGNTVVKTEALTPFFKMAPGDWFNEKLIRKGFEKVREAYGTVGYFEFTGAPEYAFPNDAKDPNAPGATGSSGPPPPVAAAASQPAAIAPPVTKNASPVVNVTMRLEEGKQYFVNRITFAGNTTTRDNVIRREMRLYEGGVFNTEALKYSVRRLNQLGYFKPLEGEAIDVQKAQTQENEPPKVDVRLKFEEQNRNQITFGAGVSQYEGFFGQLAFQTSNFMGRGETFSVSAQQGNRAKNYQVGFTEPFLFDRPITAGVNVFDQEIQYVGQYTQASKGVNTVWGFPVGPFSRMFVTYSYEGVQVKDLNPLYRNAATLANNPFLIDSLLTSQNGERKISKIGPSFQHNSVDNPIFPTTGRKFTASFDLAGLGGNTKFYDANVEAIGYFKQTNRTSLGIRAAWQYLSPYGSQCVGGVCAQSVLPIFEKVYLGGEYSIRGFDLRSVGPRDPASGLVIGGNKSILGNAEYLINIAGPVRLVLFYDIGQVRDEGEHFSLTEPVKQLVYLNRVGAADSLTSLYTVTGFTTNYGTRIDTIATTSAFKTSTGAEIRFFMPVLNVPFRLIFAMNPQRGNVLDNNLQPEKFFKFRFAVGTTF